MNKFIHILLCCFLASFSLSAQLRLFEDSLTNPSGITDDERYASHFVFYADETLGTVSYRQVRAKSIPPVVIISGLNEPRNLIVRDDTLYIREKDQISLYQLSAPSRFNTSAVFIQAVGGVGSTGGMALAGNELYFTEISTGKLRKFTLNQPNPIIVGLDSGLNQPSSVFVYIHTGWSTYSYVTVATSNSYELLEFDESLSHRPMRLVYTGDSGAIAKDMLGLHRFGRSSFPSSLYILEGGINPRLISPNFTSPWAPPIVEDSGFVAPEFFSRNNNFPFETYFTERQVQGKILYRSHANIYVSVDEVEDNMRLKIYPNPTSDDIQLNGFKGAQVFKIYNLKGELVLERKSLDGDRISISHLSPGVYIISVLGKSHSFIKK